MYECEDVLELCLQKMKKYTTVDQCRSKMLEILALVKEKKFERLKDELGMIDD
jgi:hypothetical protein